MHPINDLQDTWAMLLRTRRRNGEWVDTPVNVAVDGECAYFGTAASSGKVKRLRNFDRVEVAPCTVRGRPTGPTLVGRARLLEGEEAAEAERRMRAKHPFVYRVNVPLEHRLKRTHGVLYELSDLRPAS
jgi:PPOX class probable F420-dependent enzyme